MKLVKSLLLGSAAALAAVAGAQAADLPMRKAAPVEYVRVCTAYGAGFFYIPGTDTCLRIGGRARFEYQYTQQRVNRASSNSGYRGLGRLQVDARTQTPYGTLRAFVRFEIASRTGGYLKSGTGERYAQSFSATGVDTVAQAQKFVEVDKAFIQFAGFTAGKAASFFDFYAHDLELIGSSVGSDQSSTNLLAYTATFGGGFSATLAVEDPTFRRNPVFYNAGPTVATGGATPGAQGGINFLSGGSAFAFVGNSFNAVGTPTSAVAFNPAQTNNTPDIVGVLRYDQAWGSAQVSAASHEIRVSNFSLGSGTFGVNGGAAVPIGAAGSVTPRLPDSQYGYAVQGGLKINMPQLAPGDVLWLQAGYALGASHYTGIYGNQGQESLTASDTGQTAFPGYDMFVDAQGRSHLTESYSGTIAFLHYWTPEIRQGVFASYGRAHYDQQIRNGATSPVNNVFSGVNATSLTAAGGFYSPIGKDFSHIYVGSNLIWSPVRDLDIGVEAIYDRLEFLGGASGGRVVDLNRPLVAGGLVAKTVKYDDTALVRFRIQRDF